MIALRVIHDPGPPTLPRTWADYLLDLAIVTLVLVGMALLVFATAASASLPPQTTPTAAPTATPTPVTRYVECPFCRFVFPTKIVNAAYAFLDHDFIRIPITNTTDLETCADSYFRHAAEMAEVMRKVGAGRLVPSVGRGEKK